MRILVIDDESSIRELLAQCLKAGGHTVALAENGQEGLEIFWKEAFDCVITDRAMPYMSGDEVAKAVKDANPRVPVILLTGSVDMMEGTGEIPAGVDVVVGKPMTAEEVRQAIIKVAAHGRT